MGFDTCWKQFVSNQQFQLSSRTIKVYRLIMNRFLKYAGKSFDTITKQDIRSWIRSLAVKEYKPNTLITYLIALSTFFKYCREEGIHSTNPVDGIPFPQKEEGPPLGLSFKQLAQLRQVIGKQPPKEQLVFEVLISTGIRISELCSMKKEDIQWSERIIHIPKGKGGNGRIVLFTRKCETYLKANLEGLKDENPYVFPSPRLRNRPVEKSMIQRWFQAYSKDVGFRVTPHILRHTFSAHLVKKGMPLEYLQVLLGHENLKYTRYYARLYSQARKEVYDEWM